VHIFEIKDFIGEPQETDEMKPKWFLIKEIPYDEMWEDDKIWLPRFLKGESIEYDFYFGSDGKIRNWKKIK
jgi:hypothetical protein